MSFIRELRTKFTAGAEGFRRNVSGMQQDMRGFGRETTNATKKGNEGFRRLVTTVGKFIGVYMGIRAVHGFMKDGLELSRERDDLIQQEASSWGWNKEQMEANEEVARRLHKVNTDGYEDIIPLLGKVENRLDIHGEQLETQTQQYMDFAKVTEQDNVRATEAWMDIQAKLNMDIDETNELMDYLIGVQQETGVSAEVLQNALEKEGQAFETAGVSAEEATSWIAEFERQGVSASDSSRLFRRSVQRVGEDAFLPYIDKIKEATNETEAVELAQEAFGSRLGTMVAPAIRSGEMDIESLMETLEDTEGATEKASDSFDEQLGERWELIRRQTIVPLQEAIGDYLLTALETIVDYVEDYLPVMQETATKVFGAISDGIGILIGWVKDYIEWVNEWKEENDEQINDIKEAFISFVEAVESLLSGFLEWLFRVWDEYGEDITKVIRGTWDLIASIIETALNIITDIFNIFASAFEGDWRGVWEGIKSLFSNVWEGIQNILSSALNLIWDIAQAGLDRVGNLIMDILNWIADLFNDMVDGAIEWGRGLFNEFMKGVNQTIDYVREGINNVADTVTERIDELIEEALSWGRNLIDGFISGITERVKRVRETVSNVADTIADYLGFSSPTKEGAGKDADKWSRNLMEMFRRGIREYIPKIEEEVKTLAEVIGNQLNNIQNNVRLMVDTIDKQYELWKLRNRDVVEESQVLERQLEKQKEKHELLTQELEVGKKALEKIKQEYGENSFEAMEYTNHILQMEIAHEQLAHAIEETSKKMEEQKKVVEDLATAKGRERAVSRGGGMASEAVLDTAEDMGLVGEHREITDDDWDKAREETRRRFVEDDYAYGTKFVGGGLSLVGEKGAEIVDLPRGSQVLPNNKLNDMMMIGTDFFDNLAKAIIENSKPDVNMNNQFYNYGERETAEKQRKEQKRLLDRLAIEWGLR